MSQVCFTSRRKDSSFALTPSLPLILKHLCLFLSHSSLRPHQHPYCQYCVVQMLANTITSSLRLLPLEIWCKTVCIINWNHIYGKTQSDMVQRKCSSGLCCICSFTVHNLVSHYKKGLNPFRVHGNKIPL